MARKKLITAGNATVSKVTWDKVLGAAAFVKGFADKHKGKPFEYDAFAGDPKQASKQWMYERGRQFACLYDGKLKDGRRVLYAAKLSFATLYNNKTIR